jgi:hypothetical protein
MRCVSSGTGPTQPFLLSAGIYGGGGFLALTSMPPKVGESQGAFEFGAVTAIEFGPLRGPGRVGAGVYFRIESIHAPWCEESWHEITTLVR